MSTRPERPNSAMVPREPKRGGVFDARDRICDTTPARVFEDAKNAKEDTSWDYVNSTFLESPQNYLGNAHALLRGPLKNQCLGIQVDRVHYCAA